MVKVMFLSESNLLELCAGDIENLYLEGFTKDKVAMFLDRSLDRFKDV